MKYKFFCALLALMLGCAGLIAAPMAVHNVKGDWYDVETDFYRCSFYVGCMYPVWFASADGKIEFPRGFLLDWIKLADAPDTQLHYLHEDLFAEVTILENTDSKLVAECVGKFCKSNVAFPGVTARYRWTLQRNSPEILLEAQVSFDDNAPRTMCRINFGSLAFRNRPFELVKVGNGEWQPFRVAGEAPKVFKSPQGVMLQMENKMKIGITTSACAWNNNSDRFFTYVAHVGSDKNNLWNGQQPYSFTMKFKVEGNVTQGAAN